MEKEYKYITTPRLTTAYIEAGQADKPKLLLLHGNFSSAVFYEGLMARLEEKYYMIAPDFRCFGKSSALPVDATEGLRVFTEDLDEFVRAIGWDKFSLCGWSMGGGIAMQYVIDHCEKVEKLILQAPLSPYGFGGTYDIDGKKVEPLGIGSGAGTANQELLKAIQEKDRAIPGQVIDAVYVAAGNKLPADRREKYIDSLLMCSVGEDRCQGNFVPDSNWPFVRSGDKGVGNTMSPQYCDLSSLPEIPVKPPVMWIRGDKDIMVSDNSSCDLAVLGRMGIIPGYPGENVFPSQPMVSQTRHVLEMYKAQGGKYEEVVFAESGHGCMLDHEEEFAQTVDEFISGMN